MTTGLRILITNNTLDSRAGTELYVRDVTTSLLARGHTPIAYSTTLGEVARELRSETIPVIDDLDSIAIAPDIIHGQHHLETMTALLRFPGVPAVYFCHGWLPWEEAPPRFPRILRYVAVDNTCRDRLVYEHGIPEDRIKVLLNFVDLERFKARGPLPPRPNRALVFSNNATEDSYVRMIRMVCERANIKLDVVGLKANNPLERPESVLGAYDLVFAKGRAALESLAVGAAVVLCDLTGIGPLVTAGEFDRLRSLNFGIRTLRDQVSEEVIERRIATYDRQDAAEVSRRVRATAGREAAVDQIEEVYREVLREFRSTSKSDPIEEQRAASAYLRWLTPRLKDQTAAASTWLQAQTRPSQHAEPSGARNTLEEQSQLGNVDSTSRISEAEELSAEWQTRTAPSNAAETLTQNESIAEEAQLRVTQNRLSSVQAQLAISEAHINRITGSLGWRIVSRYGPIKYRLVLPAYNRIRKLFGLDGRAG
ncbi:MAG TPA: glycosyltransferase [Blastocatellia bacterium]|nr:glycosyltransferase [Blastocatellia bacterium]